MASFGSIGFLMLALLSLLLCLNAVSANNYEEKAWTDHLKSMQEIERKYPSRYNVYVRQKPNSLVALEYEPELSMAHRSLL